MSMLQAMSPERMILETERLRLREATTADGDFFFRLLNSPNWLAHIGDRGIKTLQAAEQYVTTRLQPQYETYGFGLWVVELQDGRIPIGICGLLRRAGLDHPDIGFAFLPEFEGKGYACESAVSTLHHGRNTLLINHVLAITTAQNARSFQLLERIGLRYQGIVTLPGETEFMQLYAITHDMPIGKA